VHHALTIAFDIIRVAQVAILLPLMFGLIYMINNAIEGRK
jgi:hypothetical protein